jgi:hypothetical protein
MSSLKDKLASVENRPFQPIFTGNLNFNKYLNEYMEKQMKARVEKQRPKTALSKSLNPSIPSRNTSRLSGGSRPLTAGTSGNKSSSETKNVTFKKLNNKSENEDEVEENASQASTNLSMFSLAQTDHTLPKMKKYNQFNYRSFFERYLNRRAAVKIPSYNMPT